MLTKLQAVAVTARNVPYLSGRVLIQVSLRHLNDVDAIIAQCRRYAASYAAAGISTDRYAIKLPFSGGAAAAARVLKAEGIPTLATSVFCVEQAVAASQAGCVMISPYYNGTHLNTSRPSLISIITNRVRRNQGTLGPLVPHQGRRRRSPGTFTNPLSLLIHHSKLTVGCSF